MWQLPRMKSALSGSEHAEKLHQGERHDQHAYGRHQTPSWDMLHKPASEWSREHTAKHEWNEVFQRHRNNFREKSGCRRDGHEELSCINRAYGVARRVP